MWNGKSVAVDLIEGRTFLGVGGPRTGAEITKDACFLH